MLIFNQNRMNEINELDILRYQKMFSEILTSEVPNITQNTADIKQQTGANNYTSLAVYYNPNPDTPSGFPYVRMDGVRNKEFYTMGDNNYTAAFMGLISPLCILYYFTKNEEYANKAIQALQVFFVNEQTKMNPDLTYSGIVIGNSMSDLRIRGAIIDADRFSIVPDLIELLKPSSFWNSNIEDSMTSWFNDLSNWLKTSDRGILQGEYTHNIRTSYMRQLCSYLCASGKSDEAKEYLANNITDVLSAQIDTDGKQILEMDRTQPRHYSNFNLRLLVGLATMSNSLGINVWNYEDAEGKGSIRKAMNYLCHYYMNPEEWTASDESNNSAMTRSWLQAGVTLYNDPILEEVFKLVKIYNFISIQDHISLPN
jgi:hypothetical protein